MMIAVDCLRKKGEALIGLSFSAVGAETVTCSAFNLLEMLLLHQLHLGILGRLLIDCLGLN